jgi:hypothetical protein
LDQSIDELLAEPAVSARSDDPAAELRHLLHASGRIDRAVLTQLNEQLSGIRRLDRQLGAVIVREEVNAKIQQVRKLLSHCLISDVRERLAALLSELYCLAAWQALDGGHPAESWSQYERANLAARESGIVAFQALASAGRAFVLVDIGKTSTAVELIAVARETASRDSSRLLRSWLAAAHGETLAAHHRRDDSLRAFDDADALLSADSGDPEGPYMALDSVHLARWRGHALARCAEPEAVKVLTEALGKLDPTFARAETALRVDLTLAFSNLGEREQARSHAGQAIELSAQIGSVRQRNRIRDISLL